MKRVLIVTLWLCLLQAPLVFAQKSSKELTQERIQKTLHQTIIPEFELKDVSFPEALEIWKTQFQKHRPKGKSITVTTNLEPPPPGTLAAKSVGIVGIPGLVKADPPSSKAQEKMTVSLKDVRADEALQYITGLANLKDRIDGDGIHILHPEAPDPMFTRDFRVRQDFIPLAPNGSWATPEAFLTANGVVFPEGSAAILNDEATRLTVHNTKDQLDLIKERIAQARPQKPPPIPGPEVPKILKDVEYPETVLIRKDLEKTILPEISLRDVSLSEAVKTLTELGARNYRGGRKPFRGFPIVVSNQSLEATDPKPTVDALPEERPNVAPRVTYSATNVSVWQALQAIAARVHYRPKIERYAVVIGKPTPADNLKTRTYLVPPFSFEGWQGPPSPAQEKAKQEAIAWLSSSGPPRPLSDGPSHLYLPSSNRLIVRDTEDKLKEADYEITKHWEAYYAVEKAKRRKKR